LGGLYILKKFISVLQHTKALKDFDSIMMMSLTISIFLPFYITIACMVLVATVAIVKKRTRKAIFLNLSNLFIMSVMFYAVVVSCIYANVEGILYSLIFLVALVTMFYGKTIMTYRIFDNMMDLACFTSVICMPIAMIQVFYFPWLTIDGRPPSTFINANYYGMIIEFVIIIAMYRIFTNKNGKMKKWYLGTILINLIGLYMSASMSSCMTLFLVMLIYLIVKGKKKSAMTVLFVLIAIISIVLLSDQILPRMDTVSDILSVRVDVWSTTLKGISDHALFGMGPGAYRMIWPLYGGFETFHAHNLYLDALLNFGVIGCCSIFFYLLTQLKILMKRLQIKVCKNRNILVLVAFAAVLIHGATDVTIFWIQTGMLFFLIYTATGIHTVKNHVISIHKTKTSSIESASAPWHTDISSYGVKHYNENTDEF